jgi:15-cis-phytoene synthase
METMAARLTRRSGTSFYYAFRLLPAQKRRAIYALYSFCRVVDDCVDESDGEGAAGLDRWLEEVGRCYDGSPTTELGRELAEALRLFPIPRGCFDDIVEGCRMDLTTTRYSTFEDLGVYCRRVASAVGLASIEIFGYRHAATREYAVELGLALQLTNILRDVGADARQGRIYIPLEDLSRFGVTEAELLGAARDSRARLEGYDALCIFQAVRARAHYGLARAALPAEDRRSMLSAQVMGALYRTLLERVVAERFPLARRVSLSRARKAWIAASTALRVVVTA